MTYNVGPDFTQQGTTTTTCCVCNESVYPEWNGHDGVWECPCCDAEIEYEESE